MEIKEIYRVHFMENRFNYVGTLRNEKKFNINDDVFFAINGNEIAIGKIVGVELPPENNPSYLYKIKLPEDLIRQRQNREDWFKDEELDKIELQCDKIFESIYEAKKSAVLNLERMYDLQEAEIERYFNQFLESKPEDKSNL